MLLPYLLGFKFGNAAFLKFNQMMPVPAIFTQGLLSKQRQLIQCCVSRFTLLEACTDEQMLGEHRFFSPELIIM